MFHYCSIRIYSTRLANVSAKKFFAFCIGIIIKKLTILCAHGVGIGKIAALKKRQKSYQQQWRYQTADKHKITKLKDSYVRRFLMNCNKKFSDDLKIYNNSTFGFIRNIRFHAELKWINCQICCFTDFLLLSSQICGLKSK